MGIKTGAKLQEVDLSNHKRVSVCVSSIVSVYFFCLLVLFQIPNKIILPFVLSLTWISFLL